MAAIVSIIKKACLRYFESIVEFMIPIFARTKEITGS